MNNFWNDRYSTDDFIYGKEPNVFFKSIINTLPPGKILIPGAGEGRDAVYAAKLGWKVFAFDQSIAAQQKALKYAKEENVFITFDVQSVDDFDYTKDTYDVVALIYFHLPPPQRTSFHHNIQKSLTQNGTIILEAFTTNQLKNSSGGPSDPSMLMSARILQQDFHDIQIVECLEQQIELAEGAGHVGKADVVRFMGKKRMK